MKRTALIAAAFLMVAAFSVTWVYAQGAGAGYGRTGQPCPYGYTQPNPQANGPGQGAGLARQGLDCPYGNVGPGQGRGAGYGRTGQPCPYGYTQPNPNAGGWWTRVEPATTEQKAFTDRVTQLHNQIREKQFEAAQLRANNGDAQRIATLDAEAQALRTELHEQMNNNREIRQQMGPAGRGYGKGAGACRAWQQGGTPNAAQQGNMYQNRNQNQLGTPGMQAGRGQMRGQNMGACPYWPAR